MANYSVTLNFFLPDKIVEALKEVKMPRSLAFDWRAPGLCHCTVKAIALIHEPPCERHLSDWIEKTHSILDAQAAFKVNIRGVSEFPGFPYAVIHSEELIALHIKLFDVLPSSQPHFEGMNYISHASLGITEEVAFTTYDPESSFGVFEVQEIQLVVWNADKLWEPKIVHRFSLNLTKFA